MLVRTAMIMTILFSFCLILFMIHYTMFYHTSSKARKKKIYSEGNKIMPSTTITTAYFPLYNKAKHSIETYQDWLTNFLSYVEKPMVIFTSQQHVSVLRSMRTVNRASVTVFVTDFSSALEMPPVKRLHSTFELNHQTDPERSYHTVDLYAVWCAKSFMLNYTAALNPFQSTYFIYIDAGAFRDSNHRFRKWPDDRVMSEIFDDDDKVLLGMISPLPKRFCNNKHLINDLLHKHEQLIQGGIIGGSVTSIRWWTSAYYGMCDIFVKNGRFIGKDQNIMNTVALSNPNRITVVLSFRISCGDVWFAFGPLLASLTERNVLFNGSCRIDNRDDLIQPLERICFDSRNLT